jgi:hypothetical protein
LASFLHQNRTKVTSVGGTTGHTFGATELPASARKKTAGLKPEWIHLLHHSGPAEDAVHLPQAEKKLKSVMKATADI